MPDDSLDKHQTGRLVRAAMAYAGKSLKAVAEESGIEYDALRNYRGPSRITRTPLEKRRAIGRACGVPDWFMEGGFANAPKSSDALQATVRQLERQMGEVRFQLGVLAVEARQRGVIVAPPTKNPQPGQQP